MLTPELMLALAAELTDAQADGDADSLAAIAWQLYGHTQITLLRAATGYFPPDLASVQRIEHRPQGAPGDHVPSGLPRSAARALRRQVKLRWRSVHTDARLVNGHA